VVPDLIRPIGTVQQEDRSGRSSGKEIHALQEGELVAGHEVRLADEVGGADGVGAEAQVRCGDGTGLARVVDEVALRVVGRLRADDLDGVLVCADGPIRAQSIEERTHGLGVFGGELGIVVQAAVGHIVVDADGEAVLQVLLLQLVEDALDHGRGEILGGEAVSPADDAWLRCDGRGPAGERLAEGGDNILVERLTQPGGLLAAVEHGDGLHRLGQRGEEGLAGKGAIEADLEQADLLALRVEVFDQLLRGAGARPHQNQDAVGIGSAHVIEQVIGAARSGQ